MREGAGEEGGCDARGLEEAGSGPERSGNCGAKGASVRADDLRPSWLQTSCKGLPPRFGARGRQRSLESYRRDLQLTRRAATAVGQGADIDNVLATPPASRFRSGAPRTTRRGRG